MCSDRSTHGLQFFYCPDDLPDLVHLGHSSIVLDVNPGIARPWCPIDPMAGSSLSRLSEESVTDSREVIESDSSRVAAKPANDFFNVVYHHTIVSLMILTQVPTPR